MGHRANLITVKDGDYILRYDHWVSNRLDDVLFWGVEYAFEYFEAQEVVGEDGWLDDTWAEGGAVIDFDKKYLLWFGGEDISYEIPLRRIFLKLQCKVWHNWTIEWASRGIEDIAEYVGYSKEKVLPQRTVEIDPRPLVTPERLDWTDVIGNIKFSEGKIKNYPLQGNVEEYLQNGKNILEQGKELKGIERIIWSDISDDSFPWGGFFIDENEKTVEFWQARECSSNSLDELKVIWDDWDISWYQDRFEFQVEKLNGKLILPEVTEERLINHLRESLLREDYHYDIENVLGTKEILEEQGSSVLINSWAYKSQKVVNPLHRKVEIWQRVFGNLEEEDND